MFKKKGERVEARRILYIKEERIERKYKKLKERGKKREKEMELISIRIDMVYFK